MKKKEKEIQKALGTYLSMKWKESVQRRREGCKLIVAGNELLEEGEKLYEERDDKQLIEERDKLIEEGYILGKEGLKLHEEGCTLYEDTIKEIYGDREVTINWTTGEVKLLH